MASEQSGSEQSTSERVGAFAACVLEDLYTAVYGERPVGVRVWCDGGALLMLLRLAGPTPFGGEQREPGGRLPYDAIPELIAAAVRVQTGCELAVGSWSVEADLGLVMFVFRLPLQPVASPRKAEHGVTAIGEPPEGETTCGRAPNWPAARVPSWRSWSPVPHGGVVPERDAHTQRQHLRLVADDRGSGSVPR
jgi:hypothetical protein